VCFKINNTNIDLQKIRSLDSRLTNIVDAVNSKCTSLHATL